MNTTFEEMAILGILIKYPEYIPVVRENQDGLFRHHFAVKMWGVISELQDRGDGVNFASVADRLIDEIPLTWMMDTTIYVSGTAPYQVSRVLKETIKSIKDARKAERLAEILKGGGPLGDVQIDDLKDAIDESEVKVDDFETGDFQGVEDEYVAYKDAKKSNITTGFPSIDRLTDHFNPGEIVSIMGRTTTGKTFVALNIMDNLATAGVQGVGFFSMEMSRATIGERINQIFFNASRHDLVYRRANGELDLNAVRNHYKDVRIYERVYSVDEVSRIITRDKLKVIFIDYLQLMKSEDGNSLYEKTTYKMHAIKAMAKNQGVTAFLLVQLSRRGEGGWEPVTIDMARDSGSIEENSDFIIGLWNPSLKEGVAEKLGSRIFMKLLKNKRGPIVIVDCVFNPNTGKIYESEIDGRAI